jgi:hypothetical protein
MHIKKYWNIRETSAWCGQIHLTINMHAHLFKKDIAPLNELLKEVILLDAKDTFGCDVEFRNPVRFCLMSVGNFKNFRSKILFLHNRKRSKRTFDISFVEPYEMRSLHTLPCSDPVRGLLSDKKWLLFSWDKDATPEATTPIYLVRRLRIVPPFTNASSRINSYTQITLST